MSAETTGIPLVVRYNSRGQPDGLKEELNIIVNSVSANEYKGGNVGGPGVTYFSALSDTPDTYDPPGNLSSIIVLTPGQLKPIGYSPYGQQDLVNVVGLYNAVTAVGDSDLLIRSGGNVGSIPQINFLKKTESIEEISDVDNALTDTPDRIVYIKPGSPNTLAATTIDPTTIVTTSTTRELNDTVFTLDEKDLSDVTATTSGLLYFDGNKWTTIQRSTLTTGSGGVTFFSALEDTAVTYGGNAGKIVVLNNAESDLVFSNYTTTNLQNFDQVYQNIQNEASPGQVLFRSGGASSVSGNAFTFFNLTDTPTGPPGDNRLLMSAPGASNSLVFSQYDENKITSIITSASDLSAYIQVNETQWSTDTTDHSQLTNREHPNAHTQYVLSATNNNLSSLVTGINQNLNTLSSTVTGINLNYLTDVAVDTPALDQVLAYDAGWKNRSIDSIITFPSLNSGGAVTIDENNQLTTIAFAGAGKFQIIDETNTSAIYSSGILWDYASEGLQVLGDVSAQNYYGNIAGATGEISNLSGVSSIEFTLNMPPEYVAVEGEVYYDTDAHTLSIQTGTDTTLQVGQEQVIRVRNDSGEDIQNGSVVYVSGTQGSGVAKLLIGKASAAVSEEEQDIIGIATETILDGHDGFITTFGIVRGINTLGTAVGDIIYLSPSAGLFTSAAPEYPNHSIRLGVVLRVHGSEGAVFAKIDPGYDIENLHNVSINGIQTGESLYWDGDRFIASALTHGDLSGLADDDHTQYVIKSPGGAARNTIQPTADVPGLTIQAGLSNTSRLLEIKNSLTQTVAYIDKDGNITADGTITGSSKNFLIDHPTVESAKLRHASLEGPENGVYYRGKCQGNVIDLPDYWTGLVDEESITVNLTPVREAQPDLFVANIENNKVYLQRSSGAAINCFYTIFATRKDIDKLVVEDML